jgi:5-methylcytosine-specific restriction protein A
LINDEENKRGTWRKELGYDIRDARATGVLGVKGEQVISLETEPDKREIERQKQQARKLRKSSWWQRKISKGICYYCGRHVDRNALTMDHIVPLIRGGKSTKGNLVPACKNCNNKKKYLLPIEWEEYVRRLTVGNS